MKKLANIGNFEALQNHANRSMRVQSEMSIFNFSDEIEDDYDEDYEDYEDEDEGWDSEYQENEDKEEQARLENKWGIHSYKEMLDKCVGHYIMSNGLFEKLSKAGTVEQINGRYDADAMQFLIISQDGADWLINHTHCPVYHDYEHDVYFLGKTTVGVAWDQMSVPTLH